jgi:hypothetical protein
LDEGTSKVGDPSGEEQADLVKRKLLFVPKSCGGSGWAVFV